MASKPPAVVTAKSLDGKVHKLDYSPMTPPNNYRTYVKLSCTTCGWDGGAHYETKTGKITPARTRYWMNHIAYYNLLMKLEPPPKPLWMGDWASLRKEGSLFVYRIDAKLPRQVKSWYHRRDFVEFTIRPTFDVARQVGKAWQVPWPIQSPWVIIEASSNKNSPTATYQALGLFRSMNDVEIYVHKYLGKKEATASNTVKRPEVAAEWPTGVAAPMPEIEAYVEHLVKISQANDYQSIVEALKEVRRGIIQLELLEGLEADLEARLTLETATVQQPVPPV